MRCPTATRNIARPKINVRMCSVFIVGKEDKDR